MESILTSIKKMLGIVEEYDHFDQDIIMHINSALSTLIQLGVGPKDGFVIKDCYAVWSQFLGDDNRLEFVKTYVYMRVRLAFDPPSSSAMIDAINRQISELEWRINVAAESNN